MPALVWVEDPLPYHLPGRDAVPEFGRPDPGNACLVLPRTACGAKEIAPAEEQRICQWWEGGP